MKTLRLWKADPWNTNFRGLSDLQREMDRMFDSFLSPSTTQKREPLASFQPATDLDENETHYHLAIDLPGVPKENVKIEINNGVLSISGERKFERKGGNKEEGSRFVERSYGEFRREFSLPKTIDADKVEARFENGVLQIDLPKSEIAKPKQIQIRDGSSNPDSHHFKKLG